MLLSYFTLYYIAILLLYFNGITWFYARLSYDTFVKEFMTHCIYAILMYF